MGWMPRSKKARRRLLVVAVAAPILSLAAALAFFAMGDAVSFFYSPAQAKAAQLAPGKTIQLGGLVAKGSVTKHPDGSVEFVIMDHAASEKVVYQGDLPDLFREGQGVVTKGSFEASGQFRATEVLAKHDEKYMPREVTKALKASGEWRGDKDKVTPAGTTRG